MHYCDCKGTTKLQLLQRVFLRMLTILVDDCSVDMSMVIAKEIIDHYHGQISFHILSNSENQGPSVSRNNGMMIAKGDYVFFLDSDDSILLQFLPTKMGACFFTNIMTG